MTLYKAIPITQKERREITKELSIVSIKNIPRFADFIPDPKRAKCIL